MPSSRDSFRSDGRQAFTEGSKMKDLNIPLSALGSFDKTFFDDDRALGIDTSTTNLLGEHYLGYGHVCFTGIGTSDIHSVVNLDKNSTESIISCDPPADTVLEADLLDGLENPRWHRPLIIGVSPLLLDGDLKRKLQELPRYQRTDTPLFLYLNNVTEDETQLDLSICKGRSFYASRHSQAAELEQLEEQRDKLRSQRPRAQLWHGRNQVEQCLNQSKRILESWKRDHSSSICSTTDKVACQHTWLELTKELSNTELNVNQLVWPVIVFSDQAPIHIQRLLAQRPENYPIAGLECAQRVWVLSSVIDSLFVRWEQIFSLESHAEIMDRVHHEYMAFVADVQTASVIHGLELCPQNRFPMTDSSMANCVPDIFTSIPFLLEMLLATKACWPAYDPAVITPEATQCLLRETGAAMAIKYWLSMETLTRICWGMPDSGDMNITLIEQFIQQERNITAKGNFEAVKWWRKMRNGAVNQPSLIRLYSHQLAQKFGEIWSEVFNTGPQADSKIAEKNWEGPRTIQLKRKVFDDFGIHIRKSCLGSAPHQHMGLALRVFARLPLFVRSNYDNVTTEHSSSEDCFFAYSALPCQQIISQWARMTEQLGPAAMGGIEVLECLLNRHQHMWTVGSEDAGHQSDANWYNSSRGLYHIALRFIRAEQPGCIAARLSKALFFLDSPLTIDAFLYANQAVRKLDTLSELKAIFGANLSDGFVISLDSIRLQQPLAWEILGQQAFSLGYDKLDDLFQELKDKGQAVLERYIEESTNTAPNYSELLEQVPALQVLSVDFWESAPIVWWSTGWNTQGSQHPEKIAGAIMGWGLIHDLYPRLVLDPLLSHRRAWPIVDLCEALFRACDLKPWWQGRFDLNTLAQRRLESTKRMVTPNDDPSDEEDVAPVTGLSTPSGHPVPIISSGYYSAPELQGLTNAMNKSDRRKLHNSQNRKASADVDMAATPRNLMELSSTFVQPWSSNASACVEPRSHRDILNRMAPHPFLLSGFLPDGVIDGFMGQVVALRRESILDMRLIKDCAQALENTILLLPEIFLIRQALRNEVYNTLLSVFESHRPTDMLVDNVSPTIYMHKITYVKRMALALSKRGINQDDSLAEAVRIAWGDGLLNAEMFQWDSSCNGTGKLTLDLLTTYPRSEQHQFRSMEMLEIGIIHADSTDLDSWKKMHGQTLPLMSTGPSQQEFTKQAFEAIIDLPLAEAVRQEKEVHMVRKTNFKAPVSVSAGNIAQTIGLVVGRQDKCTLMQSSGWVSSSHTPRYTFQDEFSCFSTGRWWHDSLRPSLAYQLLRDVPSLSSALFQLNHIWKDKWCEEALSVQYFMQRNATCLKKWDWRNQTQRHVSCMPVANDNGKRGSTLKNSFHLAHVPQASNSFLLHRPYPQAPRNRPTSAPPSTPTERTRIIAPRTPCSKWFKSNPPPESYHKVEPCLKRKLDDAQFMDIALPQLAKKRI